MKLVACTVGLAGLTAASRLTPYDGRQAKTFLRTRRANPNPDDPNCFNFREDFESFKDKLEGLGQHETEVDNLEVCLAECRKEDWSPFSGYNFSEKKERYTEGVSDEKPVPCGGWKERASCCDKVPKFVYNDKTVQAKVTCSKAGCKGGYVQMFNTCVKPKCTAGQFANSDAGACQDCPAGQFSTDAESESCDECDKNHFSSAGSTSCQRCNAGEHSSSGAASCTENQCNCSNGTAASGTACSNHGDDVCASCDAGFHSSGNACEPNVCTCANGNAATGYDCGTHNTAVCTPRGCYGDFIFNNGECVAPECSCANGVEHTDRCMTGREGCDTCNDGYHKVGTSCEENVCACNNGQGATLGACSRHGGNTCASCDSGYELSYGSCSLKRCSCPNGTPATGSACPRSGALKCTGCSDGFEIVGSGCNSIGPDNHDLRIVGGSRNRGRLEVFYRGQWGTICNDDFETIDAQVACKQMGFSDGDLVTAQQTKLLYGSGTGPIWLDNVACTYRNLQRGDKLTDCRRGAKHDVSVERPIGNHNCGHVEDVGVKCW